GLRYPQVGIHRLRRHDDARIEQSNRVEEAFHLGEQVEGWLGVHVPQQLASCPPVSVLAGHGTPVTGDQRSGFLEEGAEAAGAGSEGEINPDVDAAISEMAVEKAVQTMDAKEALEVPEVRAQLTRGNGSILPSRPRRFVGWGPATEAGAILPD